MPLLVSVRSGDEVAAALAGGADIIDAKEPARGPLGAVGPGVLADIARRTPVSIPLSIALGDCSGVQDVRRAVRAARVPPRDSAVYLKLGFAGVSSETEIAGLMAAAAECVENESMSAGIVAVAYADHEAAGTIAPGAVLRASASSAAGFLVDTWRKDGRGLLDHLSREHLGSLSAGAREAGLIFALAGSLDAAAVAEVSSLAEVIGVRGAACRGGRGGTVDAGLVASLRGKLAGRLAAEREGGTGRGLLQPL